MLWYNPREIFMLVHLFLGGLLSVIVICRALIPSRSHSWICYLHKRIFLLAGIESRRFTALNCSLSDFRSTYGHIPNYSFGLILYHLHFRSWQIASHTPSLPYVIPSVKEESSFRFDSAAESARTLRQTRRSVATD